MIRGIPEGSSFAILEMARRLRTSLVANVDEVRALVGRLLDNHSYPGTLKVAASLIYREEKQASPLLPTSPTGTPYISAQQHTMVPPQSGLKTASLLPSARQHIYTLNNIWHGGAVTDDAGHDFFAVH